MIISLIICFWIITIQLSLIYSNQQKVLKNKDAKLFAQACSVLSCSAFVWTLLVFPDKVRKQVMK